MMRAVLLITGMAMLAGCPEIKGTDWQYGDGTGEPAYLDYYTDECAWDWTLNGFGFQEPMYALCVDGSHPGVPPMNLTVEVPCQAQLSPTDPSLAVTTYTASDATTFLDETTYGGGYLCAVGDGAGDYHARFEPGTGTCDQYTKDSIGYVLQDLDSASPYYQQLYADGLCDYQNIFGASTYASLVYDKLPSAPSACTPGSATFQMIARANTTDAGDATVWLAPIAQTAARFPERAWLRRIDVVDWGTVGNLHVAPLQHQLRLGVGPNGVGGRKLDPATPTLTLAAGDTPMSTMFAASDVVLGAHTVLPTVRLAWSCEVDASHPHYQARSDGFVGQPLAAFGIPHRIVLWVDWATHKLRIAPEGRFVDHVPVRLTMLGAQQGRFTATLWPYGARLSGVITQVGNQLQLGSATVTIAGVSRALADTAFSAL